MINFYLSDCIVGGDASVGAAMAKKCNTVVMAMGKIAEI